MAKNLRQKLKDIIKTLLEQSFKFNNKYFLQ